MQPRTRNSIIVERKSLPAYFHGASRRGRTFRDFAQGKPGLPYTKTNGDSRRWLSPTCVVVNWELLNQRAAVGFLLGSDYNRCGYPVSRFHLQQSYALGVAA